MGKPLTVGNIFLDRRYLAIITIFKILNESNRKIKFLHLKYALVKNHGNIDISNKTLMSHINQVFSFDKDLKERSKRNLPINRILGSLTKAQHKRYLKTEKKINDFISWMRLRDVITKDTIFSSDQGLNNALDRMKKLNMIDTYPDEKGGYPYYKLTDFGLSRTNRFYANYILAFLPDESMYEVHDVLLEIKKKYNK